MNEVSVWKLCIMFDGGQMNVNVKESSSQISVVTNRSKERIEAKFQSIWTYRNWGLFLSCKSVNHDENLFSYKHDVLFFNWIFFVHEISINLNYLFINIDGIRFFAHSKRKQNSIHLTSWDGVANFKVTQP